MKVQPQVSIIIYIELLCKKDIARADIEPYKNFLNVAIIYSTIDSEIATSAIAIRKKYGLKLPDALIAATAVVNNLTLLTRDESDFGRIYNLNIVNPWKM